MLSYFLYVSPAPPVEPTGVLSGPFWTVLVHLAASSVCHRVGRPGRAGRVGPKPVLAGSARSGPDGPLR